ncbi:MAG: DEAD/DEAH box helicase family protein, partial [Bacteroidota bacterium]
MLVAEIILPLPVKSNFDYRIPASLEAKAAVGMRALVTFGKSKMYTGVIAALKEEHEHEVLKKLKPIEEFPDDRPVLRPRQIDLFRWIAFYYFCTQGEVLKASLPAGLKLESERVVEFMDLPEWEKLPLNEAEAGLMDVLRLRKVMTLPEVGQLWDIANPVNRLRHMEVKGLLRIGQRLKQRYKPKMAKMLEVAGPYQDEEALHGAFDLVRNAPRQEEALMLVVADFFQGKLMTKKDLKERLNGGDSAIKGLVEKGILREFEVPVDRLANLEFRENKKDITFNEEQESALAKIRASFEKAPSRPVMLHGVTGSGKTHLYIELIQEALDR